MDCVPSLKESLLSRGVFRIFFGWCWFIAHRASTPKPIGFVFCPGRCVCRCIAGRFSRRSSVARSESSSRFGGIDSGHPHGSDRRRSFPGDCTPSHPFVNTVLLRRTAGPRWRDHARNHSLRPSCATWPASITATLARGYPANRVAHSGWARSAGIVTKATTNAITSASLDTSSLYQRLIQGTSILNASHNSIAAS